MYWVETFQISKLSCSKGFTLMSGFFWLASGDGLKGYSQILLSNAELKNNADRSPPLQDCNHSLHAVGLEQWLDSKTIKR